MHIISIIPARGGSKRIPRKNLIKVGGIPLIGRTVRDSVTSKRVNKTYVSTDDDEIARVGEEYGAQIIRRPPHLSVDTATSESALIHVLDERNKSGLKDPDLVVFLECTSPLRRPDDVDGCIETLLSSQADSVFGACRFNKLLWEAKDGKLRSINWDYHHRKREQDMSPQYMENGSIYVFKPSILREFNNRLGGKIAVFEMKEEHSFQIDTPWDVELQEWIATR